jgi:hypothetical protein
MAMEHTFRPPWYHRSCMCEYMGMIYGVYDAKGGASGEFLNSCFCYHQIFLLSILHIILFHGSCFSFFTNRWWQGRQAKERLCSWW